MIKESKSAKRIWKLPYATVYTLSFSTGLLTASEHPFERFVYSALSEEEKTSLRAGLITNFNEPVNQVSGGPKND